MESIDSGKITILTASDMSAALDALDHITLLHRLQHTFGLSGYAISWIRSYLTNGSSFVKIDSSSSPSTTILTGVPKSSVLGPLLFVLFISRIANVINPDQSNQNNTVSFHQYADDTQLLTRQWWLLRLLQLNHALREYITGSWITVFIWTLPSQRPSSFTTPDPSLLMLWRSQLKQSRLLALQLSFKHQLRIWVLTLTHKCPLISRCTKYARLVISMFAPSVTLVLRLTIEASKTIAAAIVGSEKWFRATLSWLAHPFQIWLAFNVFRILLLELSHKNLGSATLRLFSRICIGFKFATELVSKSPRLLSECSSICSHAIFHLSVPRYVPARALRSPSSFSFVFSPPRKTTMATSKSFSSVAPSIWNSLPNHLSSIPTLPVFRSALKHHLFLLAYHNSSAKPRKIKPAQSITLRDTAPRYCYCEARKHHAAHVNNVPSERLRLAEVITFPIGYILAHV